MCDESVSMAILVYLWKAYSSFSLKQSVTGYTEKNKKPDNSKVPGFDMCTGKLRGLGCAISEGRFARCGENGWTVGRLDSWTVRQWR